MNCTMNCVDSYQLDDPNLAVLRNKYMVRGNAPTTNIFASISTTTTTAMTTSTNDASNVSLPAQPPSPPVC